MDPARRSRPEVAPDPPTLRSLARALLVHARCLGASLEDAEDLVHETLELVVREPAWYDPERGTLSGALKVVLRNRLLNRRRARGTHERHRPQLALVPDAPPPDVPLTAARARTHRQRFLAMLEPDERELFGAWMRQRASGERGPEVAASLGLTEAAYEAAKKRLRRRCRAILDELGLDPADLFDPNPEGTP